VVGDGSGNGFYIENVVDLVAVAFISQHSSTFFHV